ncbi:uncharacterized protein LOC120672603 isoform X3 [Panicum virgatum]|uniref:WIYLD domain-containing protein n=1 Tax=Panicum virgatum TaxID=38727 RepID=A0A8T0W483_PANVG|nr:uncharacterized protein LOC120672603 isoform X3 [Panicum virgatum]KAG2642195.1 hypothetical protein PVAP13_2KG259300 [Panicum virgatum]
MPPPPEGPPGKGDGRIDAAVDYFIAMGYAARDVRNVVEALLTVHGGAAAWPSLAEGSYRAVQEKLLEKEEEEVKLLLMGGEPASTSVSLLQPEAAASKEASPEHGMQISQVYILPFPTATSTTRLRPPTYGWISTESESESESDDGEISSAVLNPAESFLSKRKRPSRWDERPK